MAASGDRRLGMICRGSYRGVIEFLPFYRKRPEYRLTVPACDPALKHAASAVYMIAEKAADVILSWQ